MHSAEAEQSRALTSTHMPRIDARGAHNLLRSCSASIYIFSEVKPEARKCCLDLSVRDEFDRILLVASILLVLLVLLVLLALLVLVVVVGVCGLCETGFG